MPQASVAINVLTTVYSLAQVPAVVASVYGDTEAAPQASDAVGVPNEGVSGHSIVVGAGTEVEYRSLYYPSTVIVCELRSGITAGISSNKCSYNSILISASAQQWWHQCMVTDSSTAGIRCCWCTK